MGSIGRSRRWASESQAFHQAVKAYLDALPSHIWCDGGRLVVAHAGLTEGMIGRSTGAVREFCLYGDTDGATDSQRSGDPLSLGR